VYDVVSALQRVPGVLLAELNEANTKIVVAHDGAVPLNSLISAAKNAGVPTTIVGGAIAAVIGGTALDDGGKRARSLRLLVAIVAYAMTLLLAEVLLPETTAKRVLINTLVLGAWICFFAGVLIRRRS
jgi:hypothetical protein